MFWDRPTSLTEDEAEQLQAEHSQSSAVEAAHIVEFAGVRRVQLDLTDGDIVVLNKDEDMTIGW
jgi:hypothetical protein